MNRIAYCARHSKSGGVSWKGFSWSKYFNLREKTHSDFSVSLLANEGGVNLPHLIDGETNAHTPFDGKRSSLILLCIFNGAGD